MLLLLVQWSLLIFKDVTAGVICDRSQVSYHFIYLKSPFQLAK
jgi:hypothetical protein